MHERTAGKLAGILFLIVWAMIIFQGIRSYAAREKAQDSSSRSATAP